jgi:hypothetical protein
MADPPNTEWLPPLVCLEDFDGDWYRYLEALYQHYQNDFSRTRPVFEGAMLGVKRMPQFDGKDATFWHITSTRRTEDDREPDFRRCERIRWPKSIIEHVSDERVKYWENERRGGNGICLWLEDDDYLVVLRKRASHIMFWTAYPVVHENRKRKLRREYEAFIKG